MAAIVNVSVDTKENEKPVETVDSDNKHEMERDSTFEALLSEIRDLDPKLGAELSKFKTIKQVPDSLQETVINIRGKSACFNDILIKLNLDEMIDGPVSVCPPFEPTRVAKYTEAQKNYLRSKNFKRRVVRGNLENIEASIQEGILEKSPEKLEEIGELLKKSGVMSHTYWAERPCSRQIIREFMQLGFGDKFGHDSVTVIEMLDNELLSFEDLKEFSTYEIRLISESRGYFTKEHFKNAKFRLNHQTASDIIEMSRYADRRETALKIFQEMQTLTPEAYALVGRHTVGAFSVGISVEEARRLASHGVTWDRAENYYRLMDEMRKNDGGISFFINFCCDSKYAGDFLGRFSALSSQALPRKGLDSPSAVDSARSAVYLPSGITLNGGNAPLLPVVTPSLQATDGVTVKLAV